MGFSRPLSSSSLKIELWRSDLQIVHPCAVKVLFAVVTSKSQTILSGHNYSTWLVTRD